MEIKSITEGNCNRILNKHFKNNDVVLCFIMVSKHCKGCRSTKKNVEKLFEKYPSTNLHFYYSDYASDDLFSEYYQMDEMIEFPKIIIFYGSRDKTEFFEGSLSFEHFEFMHKKYGI